MPDTSWSQWAEGYLRGNWRSAVDQALKQVPNARWHPNGFVVFRLGDIERRGSHRLHIWPGGVRRREIAGHPAIHSHDWELQSLVIKGQYRDVFFAPSIDGLRLYTHDVEYGGDGRDSITPTGAVMRLIQNEVRVVDAGSSHHMDIAVTHETRIPAGETVVTYVMMGPRRADGMMLAGEAQFHLSEFTRSALTDLEVGACEEILAGLSVAKGLA